MSMSSSRGFTSIGAGPHVLVGDPRHGHLVAGHAHGGVDPEQRSLELLVVPPVGGEPFGTGHHGELAADEGDLPHRGPHDPGADVVVLGREAVHPHVGGLHYVVVDGDDPGHVGHEAECTAWSDGPSGAAAPHIGVRRPLRRRCRRRIRGCGSTAVNPRSHSSTVNIGGSVDPEEETPGPLVDPALDLRAGVRRPGVRRALGCSGGSKVQWPGPPARTKPWWVRR